MLILMMLFCSYLFGQESHGGIPLMFDIEKNNSIGLKYGKAAMPVIEKRKFPIIDNEKEQIKADSVAMLNGYGRDKFYGLGIPVNLDFKQNATVKVVGDSGKIYLLELFSPTAYALQVYFDAFTIPRGSRLFVYDSNKTMFLGSFTCENNFESNRFGTDFVKGNSLIIEYYEPNEVEFEAELHIETLVHSFAKAGPFATGSGSDACNINVNCPLGYGWDREKRSVVLILGKFVVDDYNYYGWCSGAVLNNTAQNGRPFFLTANHCFNSPMGNIMDWIFKFNHETLDCSDDGSFMSYSLSPSVFGAWNLVADGDCSPTSDYLLLELNVAPTTLTSYDVVYAGWEADETKATNSSYTIGIHHPSGDVKKMSVSERKPVSINAPTIDDCPNSGEKGTHWQVSWSQGITEGGSSGSPLFNNDHKIIGQLHGGNSFCDSPNAPDFYGKFSKSYQHGNFARWLDPFSSGATSVGPYNPSGINENCYNGIKDTGEADVDCGGNCPPCGWTSPIVNWGNPRCYDGIKNGDETGIDCGGDCRPCGGVQQCTNCQKDGDETGIDCGGSCPPCNNSCVAVNATYTMRRSMPSFVSARNVIEAKTNVVINPTENITFQAGDKIVLGPGFKANEGSNFVATIALCDCKQPCAVLYPNVFTPNDDEKNDWLVYIVSGYNRFEVEVFDRNDKKIYQSHGPISDNYVYIWDGNNTASGTAYRVKTTLYSDCLGQSKLIDHMVNVFKSSVLVNDSEGYFEEVLTDIKLNDMPKEVKIYPNPANEFITIEYPFNNKPLVYIIDEMGKVVYIKQNIENGTFDVNVSNFVKGLYNVKIVDDGDVFIKKFIKN